MPVRNINDILTPSAANPAPAIVSLVDFQGYVARMKTDFNRIARGALYDDDMFRSFGLITAFPIDTVAAILNTALPQGALPVKNPWVLGVSAAVVLEEAIDGSTSLKLIAGSCDGIGSFLFGQKRDLINPVNSQNLPVKRYSIGAPAASTNSNAPEYERMRTAFLKPKTPIPYEGFNSIALLPNVTPPNINETPIWFEVPLADLYDMIYDSPSNPLVGSGTARFSVVLKENAVLQAPQNLYFTVMPHLIDGNGTPHNIVEGPTSPTFRYQHGGSGG